jgi:hypothetical protein
MDLFLTSYPPALRVNDIRAPAAYHLSPACAVAVMHVAAGAAARAPSPGQSADVVLRKVVWVSLLQLS